MYDPEDNGLSTASALTLTSGVPESSYGPILAPGQPQGPDTFLAFTDGTLAEVPYALDAWMDQQQHVTA